MVKREDAMNSNERFITTTLRRHLPAVVLSVLLVQLCSIGNNIVAGYYLGKSGLAVMSLVNPVFFIFATLGALLCVGGSTLAAYYIGRNDEQGLNSVFTLSLMGLLALGVVIAIAGLLGLDLLLKLLGVPPELTEDAAAYLRIYLPGSLAAMGIYLPFNYLKLMGRQRLTMLIFLLMFAFNISIDLVLLSLTDLGIRAIALGTVISLYAAGGLGLYFLIGPGGEFRLINAKGRRKDALRLLKLGSPAAVNNFCNVLRVLCLNTLLFAALGQNGLAAFSVIASINSFAIAINSGSAQTMTPFAGVFCSERDNQSVRLLMRHTLRLGLTLAALFAAAVLLLPQQVCALFSVTEAEALAVAKPAVIIFAVSLLPALVNFLLIGLNQANRRTMIANALTVSRSFAAVVLLALLLWKTLGPNWIWLGFPAAELLTLLGYLLLARLYARRRSHTSPLLLLDTRAESDGRYIAFSVPNDDAAAAESAERISDFCAENDLPAKLTMTIGLALEEILISLNQHALKGLDKAFSDVRILIVEDKSAQPEHIVVLRIRCGGRQFDPVSYAEHNAGELGSDAMGIAMVSKLAQSIVFQHTFGANNLTIIF